MTRKTCSPILVGAMLASACAVTQAEVSPWYVGVVANVEHDTNVFRVGENQTLPPESSQSDTLYSASLIGGFDQNYSKQHAYGSLSLSTTRFRSNTALNNSSHALKLGLDWAAAERLSGKLSASSDKNLAQFNNRTAAGAVETVRNVQTLNRFDASVALGTVTRLTFTGALGWRKRHYSADQYQQLNFDEKYASLGTRYRASGALALGAAYRATRTDYPNFSSLGSGEQIAGRVDRRDIDFTLSWTPTGASSVDARLSPTRIRYENALDQSRSEITASAVWTWRPTDRTQFKSTFSRDTGQSAQAMDISGTQVVDYSTLNTTLKIEGSTQVTGKIGLSASLMNSHRDLARTTGVAGLTPIVEEGSDRTVTAALGLTWVPTRSTQFGCNVSRERRSSSETRLSVPLSAGIYSCYGQFVVQ